MYVSTYAYILLKRCSNRTLVIDPLTGFVSTQVNHTIDQKKTLVMLYFIYH